MLSIFRLAIFSAVLLLPPVDAGSTYWTEEWEDKSYSEQVSRLLEVTAYLATFDCEMAESLRFRAAAETLDRDMFLGGHERTVKVVLDLADPRLVPIGRTLVEMIVAVGKENAAKGKAAYPGGDPLAEPNDATKSASLWKQLRKPTSVNLNPLVEAARTLTGLASEIRRGGGTTDQSSASSMAAAVCAKVHEKCGAAYPAVKQLYCELDGALNSRTKSSSSLP